MWCVYLKSKKANRAGNVLSTIAIGEFLEKKVVARPIDGVDLQWEPLVLGEDDHMHIFFFTLSKNTSKNLFTPPPSQEQDPPLSWSNVLIYLRQKSQ
jgi:hypothetical protein